MSMGLKNELEPLGLTRAEIIAIVKVREWHSAPGAVIDLSQNL